MKKGEEGELWWMALDRAGGGGFLGAVVQPDEFWHKGMLEVLCLAPE